MILQLRETEGDPLKKYLYTSSAVAFLFWASPALISAVTFGVCILLKTPLTSGTVLSAVTTFRVLQNLPELISLMTQTKVPFDRIQEFIREEDQMKTIPDHASMSSKMSHGAVIREDCVLVMKDGKIVQSGKFEDLIANPNGQLVKQMTVHIQSLDQVKPPQEDNSLPMLLPIQLFLALVILGRNLGAVPSIAALFATILVMVSNTPLVNKQKKFHSKLMEAKD
ncbi:hypothetical protein EZV62_017427 [Acer yangbiense]|uniref:ABC transmembrane type-1 domain-containing protein n=1 Tax=Acer yangbiense TaxID=1000413 RepID=A0A5C7HGM1_9ROSI|nr:hypothetical protein EZV62_017427 [Acer yangbiense]